MPVEDNVGLHSDELKSVTRLNGSPARRGSRGMSIGDLLSSYGHLIGLFCFSGLPLLAGGLLSRPAQ